MAPQMCLFDVGPACQVLLGLSTILVHQAVDGLISVQEFHSGSGLRNDLTLVCPRSTNNVTVEPYSQSVILFWHVMIVDLAGPSPHLHSDILLEKELVHRIVFDASRTVVVRVLCLIFDGLCLQA